MFEMTNFDDGHIILDDEQKESVYACKEKSLLVLAPPGAGKTLVMAKRMEFLIKIHAVRYPYKILGLTFSNTAADQMKKMVLTEVPSSKRLVYITNFHSFAYSILKAYGNHCGVNRNFSILGETEWEIHLKNKLSISRFFSLSKYNQKRKNAQEIFERYKKWKNERILKLNPDFHDENFDNRFETALHDFRHDLNVLNLLDFDHILYYCYELLKSNENVLNYYRAVFKYILVDEFQDTNPLQFELLRLLLNRNGSIPNRSVFILADPNQGIYEFQGADPKNIDDSLEAFNCEIIKLKGDYRFDSIEIKTLKEGISRFMEERTLLSPVVSDNKPKYFIFDDKGSEASYILRKIEDFKEEKINLHDVAIIAPLGYNLDIIKSRLNENEYICIPDFKGIEIEKKYNTLFEELKSVSRIQGKLEEILKDIAERIGISNTDDILKILVKLSKKYDKKYSITLSEKVKVFSNEILLEINWGEILKKEIKNKIFLSTIHGVKGLEFEKVIICGLDSGSLPFYLSCNECNGELGEFEWIKSLKLLNVGISRAKNELLLSSSKLNNNGYDTHPTCLLKPFYRHLAM
jgi:DNA helicase-2/ATP-dependent DNA helicase PcrA